MLEFLQNAGVFVYPLGLCSLLSIAIIIERIIALRPGAVLPREWIDKFMAGTFAGETGDHRSSAGRIVRFARNENPDADGLKAYAHLEVNRMERGLFVLEIVIQAAPLLGLLGTVTGLVTVFGSFDVETGLPEPRLFVEGIATALNTTILGLAIAIPTLAGHSFLQRRIDSLAARLHVGIERLIEARESAVGRSSLKP